MLRLLLLAVLLGTAACSWILTQNTPEYATDAGSVPMSTVTDTVGGPVGKPPTAVPAIPMYITTDLRQCTHPVLDVGMAHRIGFNNRKPTCAQVWLFKAINLTGPFKTLSPPLVWSGNVTIPKTLLAENAVPNGTSHTVYGTHRFDLVNMTRMLSGNNMYYVAISLCLDRALHTPTATFNEVRWLFGLAPRNATDPPYEWIDRFGTYIPAHKELSNWTAAAGVEPWVAAPLHSVSVSQRLAARIYMQCTGPSNTSDTRILANGTMLPLWNTSMLAAVKTSPSPTPSPTPSPLLILSFTFSPPLVVVVLDLPSPSLVLSPVVEVSSSSPPPPVPVPIPSSMVVVATPTGPATPILVVTPVTTPTVTMTDWPSPGPMPTGISPVDVVPSSPILSSISTPSPAADAPNGVDKSNSVTWETIPRTWKIILGVVGGFLLLATAGLCIYFYAGYRTRRMYEVVDDREMQHKAQQEQSWFVSFYNKLKGHSQASGNGKHVQEEEADDDRILPMDEMDPEDATSKDVSHGSMDSGDEERGSATRPYRDELETPQQVHDRVERERVERLRMVQVALDTPASPSTKPKGKGKE